MLKHMFSSCLPGEASAGMAVGDLGNLPSLWITGIIVSACSVLLFQAALLSPVPSYRLAGILFQNS